MDNLRQLLRKPALVTSFNAMIPSLVSQRFRNGDTLTMAMLFACFDPQSSMVSHGQYMGLRPTRAILRVVCTIWVGVAIGGGIVEGY